MVLLKFGQPAGNIFLYSCNLMPVLFTGVLVSLVAEQASVILLRQVANLVIVICLVDCGVGEVHG